MHCTDIEKSQPESFGCDLLFSAWKQGKEYETRLSKINTDLAVLCSYSSTRVEMRGVEPLSENTLTETSPGADDYLNSLGEA